ncbi:hypothetical protein HMI01_07820 [Halolactibacillus miurensis]|uniref:Sensor_kinase_SpoOB-type, alpha-helical domain n=1 Tax=Halolactibacillus miurensis TaxID=306541 RepID=A0A1I6PK13_9BACI|nr:MULTISPECIES: Spo0B domain-containing protein [Halolactibacillus]GEM03794.1 hypothetical protein HMI01_07820 [Halolactibacillus miurensis]SFS40557.1 Sensor_kinase_SpoOB-type, alpha-helical domain [Halolactibacillus miurensis]
MKEWTCQQLLKKKRHDHANQLQLLLGYEQMQKKEKVAEILADWMQQLELERQILSLPLEKTSVVFAYYQGDFTLSIDGLSFSNVPSTEAIDERIAMSVNEVLSSLLPQRSHIHTLHVRVMAVTDICVTIHYTWMLNSEVEDVDLTHLETHFFEIEVTSKEIIMKQHVQVNNN